MESTAFVIPRGYRLLGGFDAFQGALTWPRADRRRSDMCTAMSLSTLSETVSQPVTYGAVFGAAFRGRKQGRPFPSALQRVTGT